MKFNKIAILVAAMCVAGAASAQTWSLGVGSNSNYNRTSIDYNLAPSVLGNVGSRTFYLAPEVGASYWRQHASSGQNANDVYQLSAVPMVRTYFGNKLYAEGGIGASLFSQTRFAGRELSTAFQFASQVGVGYQYSDRLSLGIRASHFSNAGIKSPNSGLNIVEARATYKF